MTTLATGGVVTTDGDYTIHTFTASGTFEVLQAPLTIDYLIVGAGGAAITGGGGAGELSYITDHLFEATGSTSVTVGAGVSDANGGDTAFITTAVGGGAGADMGTGNDGACGGGGGAAVPNGYALGGTGSIGFDGGRGHTNPVYYDTVSGGGGGMGSAGTDGLPGLDEVDTYGTAGNGGDGSQNSISGSAVWYSGGGGGYSNAGSGSGGSGSDGPGGGGTATGDFVAGQDGIVIVRYLTDTAVSAGTADDVSGDVTVTIDGVDSALSAADTLSNGTTVTTGNNGSATLRLADNSTLTVQPNSQLVIRNVAFNQSSSDSIVVEVLQGIARFVTGLIVSPRVTIMTPSAIIGLRGTDITTQVLANGTVLIVHSGSADLTNSFGTITVLAGQSGFAPLHRAPYILADTPSQALGIGKYQVVVTYLRQDGQESGAGKAVSVELFTPGAISLTSIPVSTDPTVTHKAIYATSVGGETLYRVGVIANADTTFLLDEVRAGASPLLTQFLQPPPAGDHIAYHNGYMLVAKGTRLYPSEAYSPELFDYRKAVPFLDVLTMIAPVKGGVWLGLDSQIVWMTGDTPEAWDYKQAADYGVIPGVLWFADAGVINDGQATGEMAAFFASKRGLCVGLPGGRLVNLTESRYAYPAMDRGAGIVRRHRGINQFLVTLQGAEIAANVAA